MHNKAFLELILPFSVDFSRNGFKNFINITFGNLVRVGFPSIFKIIFYFILELLTTLKRVNCSI